MRNSEYYYLCQVVNILVLIDAYERKGKYCNILKIL